ncbi:MAG TPA: FAD-binding oxidoreductase [Burkholderiaceae bacterium]|nr:FAD-binding oxidoreductase [Burkholderiaceae bacterium]
MAGAGARTAGDEPASLEPWWWRAAPLSTERVAPPARADVAIVGAGITGLVAATELALAGRRVAVLDAHAPGHGGSSRNAGYVGRSLKHGIGEIAARDGLERAVRVYGELREASESVAETVERHRIDCHWRRQGRLLLATTPAMLDALVREYALRERHVGEVHAVVDRAAQRAEVATDHYFGGIRVDDHAGLHPGLYHRGLLEAARAAGATVCGGAPVSAIRRDADGFSLRLPGGALAAREVIVATNGYSGDAWPWLRRRVIPFDAYQAVSAPLGEARVAALLPGDRTYIDWNFDVDWFRRVPDDPSRIQFGGLTGGRNEDLRSIARRLRARMLRIFPDLRELAVEHVWTGRCAGTFDFEPRIGRHDGIHYAGGYCFVGVPMGTLFGLKLARRILGRPGGESAFDRPFRTMPLYRGDPWFVPLAFRWLRRHDR